MWTDPSVSIRVEDRKIKILLSGGISHLHLGLEIMMHYRVSIRHNPSTTRKNPDIITLWRRSWPKKRRFHAQIDLWTESLKASKSVQSGRRHTTHIVSEMYGLKRELSYTFVNQSEGEKSPSLQQIPRREKDRLVTRFNFICALNFYELILNSTMHKDKRQSTLD